MLKNDTMIQVEIISIGDELLIGQTINTNASWMGQQLADKGIKVNYVQTISDTAVAISDALHLAISRSNVVLITGGLGPTKDDITKHTLAEFFRTGLRMDDAVLKHVTDFFTKRNRPMLEVNRQQALVPENAQVLFNEVGTAPGMWFEHEGAIVVSMPGVPYEMKYLFETHIIPRLRTRFEFNEMVHKTALTQGIGESFLAQQLEDWENELRAEGMELAYLPSPGMVKLRITSKNADAIQRIDAYFNRLSEMLPIHMYGFGEVTLAQVVGELLRERNQQIGTVESCTGGKLASQLVSISGASDYFQGSLLTYSNRLKHQLAKVKQETLEQFGAVSEETVLEMAQGGKEVLGVDWCISVSGIAGPTGGTEEKPVGTVWVGISGPNVLKAWRFSFGEHRDRTMEMTCLTALNLLRCELLGLNN
jgi:nicotinamide-nucleotide amidase